MAGARGEYRKSAQRRQEILDAAFEVFSRTGFTGSSVNEIAAAVGMTQTGLLHHFKGGKLELLRQVLAQRDARSAEYIETARGRDLLRRLIDVSREQSAQRGLVQLYVILSAEATDPDHRAHGDFAARFRRIQGAVQRAYTEVADEGGLRPGISPRFAAVVTIAATEGLELMWLSDLDVDMAEDIAAVIDGFLIEPL